MLCNLLANKVHFIGCFDPYTFRIFNMLPSRYKHSTSNFIKMSRVVFKLFGGQAFQTDRQPEGLTKRRLYALGSIIKRQLNWKILMYKFVQNDNK